MSRLDEIFRQIGFPDPPSRPPRPQSVPPRDLPVGKCGKVNFPTERMAEERRRTLLKHKTSDTSFLRVYFCRECRAHHLTSSRR